MSLDGEINPTIGAWYRNRESGQLFEVVALDEDDGTIEIQYFDSEIEEVDIDTWYDMLLETAAEPEDWSGPFDDLVADDFGDTGEPMHPESWGSPFDEFDAESGYEIE